MKNLTAETIRLKFRNSLYIPATNKSYLKRLAAQDFTIISNNCWAGTVYESYGLRKTTPTVGMYIMPDDYLLLLENFQETIQRPLVFIDPDESKWKMELGNDANWGKYLIGRIGDVELQMLHYHDESVARRKWESRVTRINLDKLMFKFNDQNGCTEEHAHRFDRLDLENKVFFTVRQFDGLKSGVMVRSPRSHDSIRASYEPLGAHKSFNVHEYLNTRFSKYGTLAG